MSAAPTRICRSPSNDQRNGFTLVELLVVIVIIGSLASLAIVTLGRDTGRELENESRRLHALLTMAADLAILESREIGLQLHGNSYRFLQLDPEEGTWVTLPEEGFEEHVLPNRISVELALEGASTKSPGQAASGEQVGIILFSSGEITPFEITLLQPDSERPGWQIGSDGFSTIALTLAEDFR